MSEENLKEQRDRFLAFSFASADLFVEVSEENKILFAMGAAKGLTGFTEKELIGRNWLEIFSFTDQAEMQTIFERAKPGMRCGPMVVHLNEKVGEKRNVLTAIKMPGKNNFYITLGMGNALMQKLADPVATAGTGELLNIDTFADTATDAMSRAKALGKDVNVTLFDFAPTEETKARLGDEAWGKFKEALGELLIGHSFDGFTAAEIAPGRYSLLHNKDEDISAIQKGIEEISKESDPQGEGVVVESKTITSDLKDLSERNFSRALVYTIHEFERKGADLTIETLNSGFESYVNANAEKMKEFKDFIKRSSFNIHFQPIVDMKTLKATHFEMLCRFEHGNTQEWVMFGEDLGLAPEFDMAICERAINYVKFKAGTTRTKFSINLSGQSIEDTKFFEDLQERLAKHPNLHERLMFEITESAYIQDLNKVKRFITELRADGYKVALDDFGAGATSFQYLQKLEVDYVKIDGKYIRRLLTSQRDVALVKNLAQMCQDLGTEVIAEVIEDQQQADLLMGMGIKYGQGYLYAKPSSQPDYLPPQS